MLMHSWNKSKNDYRPSAMDKDMTYLDDNEEYQKFIADVARRRNLRMITILIVCLAWTVGVMANNLRVTEMGDIPEWVLIIVSAATRAYLLVMALKGAGVGKSGEDYKV